MDCLRDIITLLKDLVTIFAAGTAAFIAIRGYDIWKKQLRGKTEYELARRLLHSVYRVREAIRLVRKPVHSMAETRLAMQEAELEMELSDLLDPQHYAMRQDAVYAQRWRRFEETFRGLEVDVFEAEVLWGQDIVAALEPLRQYTTTLGASIGLYLHNLSDENMQQSEAQADEARRIIYSRDQDDEFGEGIQKAVETVENVLKPYLTLQ